MNVDKFTLIRERQENVPYTAQTYRLAKREIDHAIMKDNIYALNEFFKDNPNFSLNLTLNYDSPPIHMAARQSTSVFLGRLIHHFKDEITPDLLGVNNFEEDSALSSASIVNKADNVSVLLYHGAKIDEPSRRTGFTPLIWAASNNCLEVVKLLCENGASLDIACANGFTALQHAVAQGYDDIVATLITEKKNTGTLVSLKDEIFIAVSRSQASVLKTLLENDPHAEVNINLKNKTTGITPLMSIASANDSLLLAEILLESGANPTITNWQGDTALMLAASVNNVPLLKLLASKAGVDIDARSHTYPELLGEEGHDISSAIVASESKHGQLLPDETALMVAARLGHLGAVRLLLELNADVQACNAQGLSVLMLAVHFGTSVVIQELIAHGAKIDFKTESGLNMLSIAVCRGEVGVLEVLLAENIDVNQRLDSVGTTAMLLAVKLNKPEIISVLARAGADIEAFDDAGHTPLARAAYYDHLHCLAALLALNANVDGSSRFNVSPLMLAILNDNLNSIKALINAGADIEATDDNKKTVLMAAAEHGNKNVVSYLIGSHVSITPTDLSGKTAKAYAELVGASDVVAVLEEHGDNTPPYKRIRLQN